MDRNGTILAESFDTFDIVAKKEKILSEETFIANAKNVFKFQKSEVDRLKKEFKNKKLKEITLQKPRWRILPNFQLINTFSPKWN